MRSSEFIKENKKKSEVKKKIKSTQKLPSKSISDKKDEIYDNMWINKNKFSTDYILNLLDQEEK